MADPVKYTFDKAFDGGAKTRYEEDVAALEAEIKRTEQSSYAKGVEDGRAAMKEELEAATIDLVKQLIIKAEALHQGFAEVEAQVTQDMGALSYQIADKLALGFREHIAEDGIAAMVGSCLASLHRESELRVTVSETTKELVQPKIAEVSAQQGLKGRITVIGDPELNDGDCRIHWGEGYIERDQAAIDAQVKASVVQFLGIDTSSILNGESAQEGEA